MQVHPPQGKEPSTLTSKARCRMRLCERLEARGWSPLFEVKGPVHDEAVCIFYSNIFDENYTTFSFYTPVNKVPIHINLDYISNMTGIPKEFYNLIAFPPLLMMFDEKADMMI